MPTTNQHLRKVDFNRRFLNGIPGTFPDWLVTVRFYIAVHTVDAYLATKGVERVRDHRKRRWWLGDEKLLRRVETDYRQLEDLSVDARYGAHHSSSSDVSDANSYLARIENEIGPHLPSP